MPGNEQVSLYTDTVTHSQDLCYSILFYENTDKQEPWLVLNTHANLNLICEELCQVMNRFHSTLTL